MQRNFDPVERDREFDALVPLLSIESLERLRGLMRAGVAFDHIETAKQMIAKDRQAVAAAMPPIPADLRPYVISSGDADEYRCFLTVDPSSIDDNVEARLEYIRVLRRRQRHGDIDAAMPSLPDSRRNTAATIARVFGASLRANKTRTTRS